MKFRMATTVYTPEMGVSVGNDASEEAYTYPAFR